jgi:Uma2 family endonuclease
MRVDHDASSEGIDDVCTAMMTVGIPYFRTVRRGPLRSFRRAEHRMGMPALSPSTHWTAEMVRALPDDGNRYECIDGELLVTPSPGKPHQFVVGAFYRAIFPYVEEMGVGLVLVSPLDVELADGMIVQPDTFVFRDSASASEGRIHGSDLLLVVEVLSKSTVRRDRTIKREFYARIGVHEYWIVDQAARRVERWHAGAPEAELESGTLIWQPPGATRPLLIDLPTLFEAIPERYRAP